MIFNIYYVILLLFYEMQTTLHINKHEKSL